MHNGQDYSGISTTPDEALPCFSPPHRTKTARGAFIKILCLCSILAAPTAVAQECESSTVARRLGIDKATIRFETLDEKQGSYVATLKNGDLVMASFSQCGLGMHAHFYSRTPISGEAKSKTLRWFVTAVLPSQAAYAALAKQIDSAASATDKNTYTFTGANEEAHSFEFKPSESPQFSTAFHYSWNPPLH